MPRSYSFLTAVSEVTASAKRTPADLKWLLNEHAAIVGEQELLRRRISQLQARLRKVEALRQRLSSDLKSRQQRLTQTTQLISALDTTIAMSHPAANPEAGGAVRAWAGRYGKRGALRAYLLKKIQTAGPDGISTTQLIESAIQHFQLPVKLPSERASIRNSVKSNLGALHKDGLTEATSVLQPNGHPLNYWRVRDQTTLSELRALVALQGTGRECGHDGPRSDPDCARGEVGGQ